MTSKLLYSSVPKPVSPRIPDLQLLESPDAKSVDKQGQQHLHPVDVLGTFTHPVSVMSSSSYLHSKWATLRLAEEDAKAKEAGLLLATWGPVGTAFTAVARAGVRRWTVVGVLSRRGTN